MRADNYILLNGVAVQENATLQDLKRWQREFSISNYYGEDSCPTGRASELERVES